jgi:hypothetical protein
MGTYAALHVNTNRVPELQQLLRQWLERTHRGAAIESTAARFPDYGDGFTIGESPPTCLTMINRPKGWVTIHFNSFYSMADIAQESSAHFSTSAVVVFAQSVSEAYEITVFDKGVHLRSIAFSGDCGRFHRDEGHPLPFESCPLGRNIAEPDEEPFYFFGREETMEYCRHLGLQLPWDGASDEGDYNVLTAHPPVARKP